MRGSLLRLTFLAIQLTACNELAAWDDLPPVKVTKEPAVATELQVTASSAGNDHTCAIVGDKHAVACWGKNDSGQLGVGDKIDRNTPTMIEGLEDVRSLGVGRNFTCAVTGKQRIYCWGSNMYSTVDPLSTSLPESTSPRPISDLSAQAVHCGANFACALTGDDRAYCWGTNDNHQISSSDKDKHGTNPIEGLRGITSFAAGYRHACAIAKNDQGQPTVYCWGANDSGQLGAGADQGDVTTPRPVVGVEGARTIATNTQAPAHSCAILSNGTVTCWGSNASGQLGTNDDKKRTTPKLVPGLVDVVEISLGAQHTCATTKQGRVYCWGSNDSGQLASDPTELDKATTPRLLNLGGGTVSAVQTGAEHSCAVLAGRLYCWGGNEFGQLGNGESGSRTSRPTEIKVSPTKEPVAR